MSPDFDDLVGSDLELEERERLERVHELLVAAGPPPAVAPTGPVKVRHARGSRRALLALAAALAFGLVAVGAVLVTGSGGRDVAFDRPLSGVGAHSAATATLTVFELDSAGNWPMEFEVDGLAPARSGRPYELWLTRNGELAALCGSFLTDDEGGADVPMNAPYTFADYDGWVVVEEGSRIPLLTT